MADLTGKEAEFDAAHDVCDKCEAIFALIEGCPCKACGRKHWHDEVCWLQAEAGRRLNLVGSRMHTRQGIAHHVLSKFADKTGLVVGFASNTRENRVQVWLRSLPGVIRPYHENEWRAALEALRGQPFEVVTPPMCVETEEHRRLVSTDGAATK